MGTQYLLLGSFLEFPGLVDQGIQIQWRGRQRHCGFDPRGHPTERGEWGRGLGSAGSVGLALSSHSTKKVLEKLASSLLSCVYPGILYVIRCL